MWAAGKRRDFCQLRNADGATRRLGNPLALRLQQYRSRPVGALVEGGNPDQFRIGELHIRKAFDQLAEYELEFELREPGTQTEVSAACK